MRPGIRAVLVAVALFGCGGAVAQMDNAKATAVMTKSGCQACHALDKKGVGPAYKDVAKKYKGDTKAPAMLAEKVRKGGSGTWGPVPMPPSNAGQISDDDLRQLVQWLLALS